MGHQKLKTKESFSDNYDHYKICFNPDIANVYITNQKYNFYEFPGDFKTQQDALEEIKANAVKYYKFCMDYYKEHGGFGPIAGKLYVSTDNEVLCIDL